MKKHLNYDGDQSNGIIFNNLYAWGALYTGSKLKPDLGMPYDSFQYGNAFDAGLNHLTVNGVRHPFPKELESVVIALVDSWVQPTEQEGGIEWTRKRDIFKAKYDIVRNICVEALKDAGEDKETISLFF